MKNARKGSSKKAPRNHPSLNDIIIPYLKRRGKPSTMVELADLLSAHKLVKKHYSRLKVRQAVCRLSSTGRIKRIGIDKATGNVLVAAKKTG